MKVTLYMAISADGFIAKEDGDSDWVTEEDGALFEQKILEAGCFFVGKKTFNQYYDELYPIKKVDNIVLTNSVQSASDKNANVHFIGSPQKAIKLAQKLGHHEVMLIGGGSTNGTFLEAGLIDEVILSVYPLIFGNGIRLFGNSSQQLDLKLLSTNKLLEGIVQFHYELKK